MTGASPLDFVPTLPPEDVARANFYALLARLFYAPPDEALLRTLAGSVEAEAEEGGIGRAWLALSRAAAAADEGGVREEYDTAFVGTGKSPVTLYTTAYSTRFSNEVPLVELKADLAALGLSRRPDSSEPEDHVAALCDVMRYLITERPDDLEAQKEFFEKWIQPTAGELCAAIARSDCTSFYKSVAALLGELCTIEHGAFEML